MQSSRFAASENKTLRAYEPLAESTRETDLDWNEHYAEIMKEANLAIQRIDSGSYRPPQLSPGGRRKLRPRPRRGNDKC